MCARDAPPPGVTLLFCTNVHGVVVVIVVLVLVVDVVVFGALVVVVDCVVVVVVVVVSVLVVVVDVVVLDALVVVVVTVVVVVGVVVSVVVVVVDVVVLSSVSGNVVVSSSVSVVVVGVVVVDVVCAANGGTSMVDNNTNATTAEQPRCSRSSIVCVYSHNQVSDSQQCVVHWFVDYECVAIAMISLRLMLIECVCCCQPIPLRQPAISPLSYVTHTHIRHGPDDTFVFDNRRAHRYPWCPCAHTAWGWAGLLFLLICLVMYFPSIC